MLRRSAYFLRCPACCAPHSIHNGTGERHRESVVQSIAANLDGWTREVKRETAVYHTLNKLSMDVTRKVLVAEAWVPTKAKAQVQEALQAAAQRSSASVSFNPHPPPAGLPLLFFLGFSGLDDVILLYTLHPNPAHVPSPFQN